ncbi:MAG: DUF4159 domain-containing protein [Myxococcota bacterium]
MTRRHFLKTSAALVAASPLLARRAAAIGPEQKMAIMRIQYDGGWDVNPGALEALSEVVRYRTSADAAPEQLVVPLTSPRLHDSMFAFVAGDRPFSFSQEERTRLERWLGLGGFMVFDNAGRTAPDQGFDRSVRTELQAMFPDSPLERVSPEHVIYRTFYRLDYPAGRAIFKPYIEGIRQGSRFAAVLCHNDLLGALSRDEQGNYLKVPTPGGENQREMAMRFGLNLMLYSSCLHYKDDQVHIDFLLHKRKWKITPPE